MRISDPAFPFKDFFGPQKKASISVQDINQGYIGNCWIMAGLSALAERPSRIDKLMESDAYNPHGIYAMNIYSLGVPFTQIVDDRIPVDKNSNWPKFAKAGKDLSIWMTLVEKGFGKWYGNYQNLVGGWMAYAVSAVNGSPFAQHWHDASGWTEDIAWNKLKEADARHDIVTTGSEFCGNDDE
jgi:hypothetical protein